MPDSGPTFFDAPVAVSAGMPLRVAVYNRIAEGIRSGRLELGSALPSETELGTLLGVSRTVAREALMLLEEDGLVRARRGVGRFVTSSLPRLGLERIQPIDRLLSGAIPGTRLARSKIEIELASTWIAEGLGLRDGDNCWTWEAMIIVGDLPVGITQEHVAAGSALARIDERLADSVDAMTVGAGSLLGLIEATVTKPLGPGDCQISVSHLGATRAAILGAVETDPALVITQSIAFGGRPLYLAKHVMIASAAQVSVFQAT